MSPIIAKQEKNSLKSATKGRQLVVTIDGPAGAGKTTVAKCLAAHLGYSYLDTGAFYRALAWKMRACKVAVSDSTQVERLLSETDLQLAFQNDDMSVFVDSQDVTSELRTPDMSLLASAVASIPTVRQWLLPIQQRFGIHGGIVAEGRDMGTRVFPSADVKFFLDADLETRAARRYLESLKAGKAVDHEKTLNEIETRDAQDRTRTADPLVPAPDAIRIDTSHLTVDQVVQEMMEMIPPQP